MKLGIISDCIHVRDEHGRIGSANHVYVSQMNALASRFSNTVFCTPVIEAYPNMPPISYYTQPAIQFIPLPLAGGKTWKHKLSLFSTIPIWLKSFQTLGKQVDIIYQRFPNNLNIPGLFYVLWSKKKAFATYTGTWNGYDGESLTYRFQRFLLKYLYPWPVFVYDNQIQHTRIFPTISPSYSLLDWEKEVSNVNKKIEAIQQRSESKPLVLLSVGALTTYKNHIYLLKACEWLKNQNRPFKLYIAGQGKQADFLNEWVNQHGLREWVHFLGLIPQTELQAYYREADFVIQPSIIEGYGKVPVEAMFHGAIPILSPVSMHPFFVGSQSSRGALLDLNNPSHLLDILNTYTSNTQHWIATIEAGRLFGKTFTLEAWTESMVTVLKHKNIYT